jgi:hypothetical protein
MTHTIIMFRLTMPCSDIRWCFELPLCCQFGLPAGRGYTGGYAQASQCSASSAAVVDKVQLMSLGLVASCKDCCRCSALCCTCCTCSLRCCFCVMHAVTHHSMHDSQWDRECWCVCIPLFTPSLLLLLPPLLHYVVPHYSLRRIPSGFVKTTSVTSA